MAAGAPGLALATVAISLRSETAGAAPPPLDTALARLATVLGSVFEERPAALDVVARCFGAPSAWVALDRQRAHAGPATVAEASEVVATVRNWSATWLFATLGTCQQWVVMSIAVSLPGTGKPSGVQSCE